MKHFQGLRRGPRETISLKVTSAMAIGTAVGLAANTTDAIVAAGLKYRGHLQQDVTADGVTAAMHHPGLCDPMFSFPAKVGDYVDVEDWDEFEAEGAHVTLTGATGGITAGTALLSKLAYHTDGKIRVAQTGDYATLELVLANLTVQDSTITDNVRIWVRRLQVAELI